MKETKPRYVGLSSDHRTNRWEITCPKCGHKFVPRTTMLASQELVCPARKCGAAMAANYNEEKVVLCDSPQDQN